MAMDPLTGAMDLGGDIIQAGAALWQGNENVNMQRETNAMTIDLANTAIQRRARDLAAAGINPLMAGRIGGADTPTLAAPQMRGAEIAGEAINKGIQGLTPMTIKKREMEQEQQAMNIESTKQEIELKKANAQEAMANALSHQAEAKYTDIQAGLEPEKTRTHMKLEESQTAEAQARTLTENMSRDPKVRILQSEATSADYKAKADQYIPDMAKATAAIEKAKAKWQEALSSSQAQQADAMAKIITNDLVKSGQLVDTDIAKAQTEYYMLTSKAGQEALALQLAKATYGANAAKPYIDNILKSLQAASIGLDMWLPQKGGVNINKTWNFNGAQ